METSYIYFNAFAIAVSYLGASTVPISSGVWLFLAMLELLSR